MRPSASHQVAHLAHVGSAHSNMKRRSEYDPWGGQGVDVKCYKTSWLQSDVMILFSPFGPIREFVRRVIIMSVCETRVKMALNGC